ncbi:hypothetical protein AJ87_23560 [Rhizobium yanglingense]|nr:hypothetical protein AJ87_23560 [Rhizobium yanglingense]
MYALDDEADTIFRNRFLDNGHVPLIEQIEINHAILPARRICREIAFHAQALRATAAPAGGS